MQKTTSIALCGRAPACQSVQVRRVEIVKVGASPLPAVAGTGVDERRQAVDPQHPTVVGELERPVRWIEEPARQRAHPPLDQRCVLSQGGQGDRKVVFFNPVDQGRSHPKRAHRRRIPTAGQDVRLRNGVITVNAFFRDSHMGSDGVETVIHEYTVTAAVDAKQMSVIQCQARPRVLPWRECPQAAGSAARLAGMSVVGLRRQVREEFVGPTTCTHLNDSLRGLEDVDHLARTLQASR